MERIRNQLSPGLALGVIAIVVALAGTSMALPGKNSVDKGDLKKNSVGASEVGAFSTATQSVPVPSGKNAEVTAICSNGQIVSGGVKWDNPNVQNDSRINESYLSGNGWYGRGENQSGNARTLTVEAYCLNK